MYMYVMYVISLAAVGGFFHDLVRKLNTVCTVHADQVDSATSFFNTNSNNINTRCSNNYYCLVCKLRSSIDNGVDIHYKKCRTLFNSVLQFIYYNELSIFCIRLCLGTVYYSSLLHRYVYFQRPFVFFGSRKI